MLSVRVRDELAEEIDRRAAGARMDRSEWIRTVLAAAVYGPDVTLDQAHPPLALQIQGVAQGTVRAARSSPAAEEAVAAGAEAGDRIPVERRAKPLGNVRITPDAPAKPFGDVADETPARTRR